MFHRPPTICPILIDACPVSFFQAMDAPFKYIVNCVIVQQSNAGLNIATSVFWDSDRDGDCTNLTTHESQSTTDLGHDYR